MRVVSPCVRLWSEVRDPACAGEVVNERLCWSNKIVAVGSAPDDQLAVGDGTCGIYPGFSWVALSPGEGDGVEDVDVAEVWNFLSVWSWVRGSSAKDDHHSTVLVGCHAMVGSHGRCRARGGQSAPGLGCSDQLGDNIAADNRLNLGVVSAKVQNAFPVFGPYVAIVSPS